MDRAIDGPARLHGKYAMICKGVTSSIVNSFDFHSRRALAVLRPDMGFTLRLSSLPPSC